MELGRSARAAASLGVRQPLPRALAGAAGFAGLPAELRDQVAGELNVRVLEALSTVGDDLVDHVVKPNFRTLGRRFGNRTQAVAAAITAVDPGTLAGQLAAAGEASVPVNGEPSYSMGLDATPNHHELALSFAFSDNFYLEPAVSSDGHRWLTNTYTTEFEETHLGNTPSRVDLTNTIG